MEVPVVRVIYGRYSTNRMGYHVSVLSGISCTLATIQEKLEVATLFNQIQRLKEKSLILVEIVNYVKYFKDHVRALIQKDIEGLFYCLFMSVTIGLVCTHADTYEQLDEKMSRSGDDVVDTVIPEVDTYDMMTITLLYHPAVVQFHRTVQPMPFMDSWQYKDQDSTSFRTPPSYR